MADPADKHRTTFVKHFENSLCAIWRYLLKSPMYVCTCVCARVSVCAQIVICCLCIWRVAVEAKALNNACKSGHIL